MRVSHLCREWDTAFSKNNVRNNILARVRTLENRLMIENYMISSRLRKKTIFYSYSHFIVSRTVSSRNELDNK